MDKIGSVAEFPTLNLIWRAVMGHCPYATIKGITVFTRRFSGGTIFGMDYQNRRYVEQNPKTSSQYGARARNGAEIMWIIDLAHDVYLGRIDEGIVYAQPMIAATANLKQKETP